MSAVHDLVVDLFGGSGSTLIACERQGRRARLMELDPGYGDVVIQRWQRYKAIEDYEAAWGPKLIDSMG